MGRCLQNSLLSHCTVRPEPVGGLGLSRLCAAVSCRLLANGIGGRLGVHEQGDNETV